jgi:hypothetical protein
MTEFSLACLMLASLDNLVDIASSDEITFAICKNSFDVNKSIYIDVTLFPFRISFIIILKVIANLVA